MVGNVINECAELFSVAYLEHRKNESTGQTSGANPVRWRVSRQVGPAGE